MNTADRDEASDNDSMDIAEGVGLVVSTTRAGAFASQDGKDGGTAVTPDVEAESK